MIRRYWTPFSIAILVLAAAWIWISAADTTTTPDETITAPQNGFLAPDFELETLDGERAALSDYRGQVVLINLWASWCPPCRAEMPAMQAAYTAFQDQGFVILAVNATHQDSLQDATAFVEERGLTFPILLDREGIVAQKYRSHLLPTSFFVDREGIIRYKTIGSMSEALLRTRVQELLEEAP
jgi:peroxiredoxin